MVRSILEIQIQTDYLLRVLIPHPPPAKVSFWNLKFSSCFHQRGWFLDPPFALTTFCQPAPGCHLVENFTSTRLKCSGAVDDRCETNPPIYFGLAIREINTLTKLIQDTFICYFLVSWYTQTKAYFTLWFVKLYQIESPHFGPRCFFHYCQKHLANTYITKNKTS